MRAANRPPSQTTNHHRRGAGLPLRLVAKDLVSAQFISWPAVQQFWDVHGDDADLAVIAALFHGISSLSSYPLMYPQLTQPKLYRSELPYLSLSFSLALILSTRTASGIAKKKAKLPEQLAREMVDK